MGPNSSIYQDVNFPEDLTIQKILNRSEHCAKHIDERMIAKYKKYKFVELEEDEMVLVRLRSKGWKGVPKRHFVVEGKVIKKCERAENYRVSLFQSGETVPIKLWIGIEDISALKKDTNHLAKEWKKCPSWHFLIPLKEWSYWHAQKSKGYKIIFDPSGDGSCQFSAIAYFFSSSGFDCSEEVVDYLKTHRKNVCSQKSYQLIHNQRIICFEKSEKIHFMV